MQSVLDKKIDKAVELLKNNDVVGMPTETVYGLAGSIYSEEALLKIFKIKERPFFDPLIIHVSSVDEAKSLVKDWPHAAELLAQNFWPGPLTLILEKSDNVNDLITAGMLTVGIRMPNHPVALALIKKWGSPLAAPSANKFKKTSPTTALHVKEEFDQAVYVLDGGNCSVGLESTILYIKQIENNVEIEVLRKGFISYLEIEKILLENNFKVIKARLNHTVNVPGNMQDHYMPKRPLIILSEGRNINESKLKFKSYIEMKLSDLPELAARELYSQMRILGQSNHDVILFKKMGFHQGELWEAILDRLNRASSEII